MSLGQGTAAASESQNNKEQPYPGFLQAGFLLIIYNLLVLCLIMLAVVFGMVAGTPIHMDPLVRTIVYLGALVFVIAYGTEKSRKSFGQLFSFKAIGPSLLPAFIITIIGVHIVLSGLNSYVISIIPGGEAAEQYILDFLRKDTYAFIIFTIVIGPFVEELMFRGLIVSGFQKRYRARKTIILSALLFAAYHGNAFQFMPSFFIGIILAWWFINTGSLVSSLFGHAISNALIILAAPFIVAYFPQLENMQQWPLQLYILGTALLVIGILLSASLFKKHRARNEPQTQE